MPSSVSNVEVRAECRLCERERDLAHEVVPVTGEAVVRPHADVDVQVAGGATARPDRATAGQPQRGPGVDARGDVDADRSRSSTDAALAAAGRAGRGDDLAGAPAARARSRGDHLAEDRLAHTAHLAGAAALVARRPAACLRRCRARCRSRTPPRCAPTPTLGSPNTACSKSRSITTSRSEPRGGPAGPRLRAAEAATEERVEDVTEPAEALRVAGEARHAFGAEPVVARSALRVREHLVGLRDLLEPRFGSGESGLASGWCSRASLRIRPLDLVADARPRDAEHLVVVRRHRTEPSPRSVAVRGAGSRSPRTQGPARSSCGSGRPHRSSPPARRRPRTARRPPSTPPAGSSPSSEPIATLRPRSRMSRTNDTTTYCSSSVRSTARTVSTASKASAMRATPPT